MSFFDAMNSPESMAETTPSSDLVSPSRPEVKAETSNTAALPTAEPAAGGLIVEDSAEQVGPGQMRKSEFLSQLKTEVCTTVNAAIAETGRNTDGCPYIANWFDYYTRQGSGHLERAILKYTPEAAAANSARSYISTVTRRAGEAAATWAKTGQITGIPDGIPITLPGMDLSGGLLSAVTGIGGMLFKAKPGGPKPPADPRTIQHQMGEGRPLDSPVRSRMESAFGHDFSHVRTHTNSRAAGLSGQYNARAFTIGSHVAFGSGEYQPGTVMGDGLIAHELAHVVQQGNSTDSFAPLEISSAPSSALEQDADRSAMSVMTSLLGHDNDRASSSIQRVLPALRSGLRLSRCTKSDEVCKKSVCEKSEIAIKKTVTINPTILYKSTANPDNAISYANDEIYNQANITLKKGNELNLKDEKGKEKSKNILGNDFILDEYDNITKPTDEEKKLFKVNQSPGAASVYFVQGLSQKSLGENFSAWAGVGFIGSVVGNKDYQNTFAHELGHLLLNQRGSHHDCRNNLMHKSAPDPKDLTCEQIKRMRVNDLAK